MFHPSHLLGRERGTAEDVLFIHLSMFQNKTSGLPDDRDRRPFAPRRDRICSCGGAQLSRCSPPVHYQAALAPVTSRSRSNAPDTIRSANTSTTKSPTMKRTAIANVGWIAPVASKTITPRGGKLANVPSC